MFAKHDNELVVYRRWRARIQRDGVVLTPPHVCRSDTCEFEGSEEHWICLYTGGVHVCTIEDCDFVVNSNDDGRNLTSDGTGEGICPVSGRVFAAEFGESALKDQSLDTRKKRAMLARGESIVAKRQKRQGCSVEQTRRAEEAADALCLVQQQSAEATAPRERSALFASTSISHQINYPTRQSRSETRKGGGGGGATTTPAASYDTNYATALHLVTMMLWSPQKQEASARHAAKCQAQFVDATSRYSEARRRAEEPENLLHIMGLLLSSCEPRGNLDSFEGPTLPPTATRGKITSACAAFCANMFSLIRVTVGNGAATASGGGKAHLPYKFAYHCLSCLELLAEEEKEPLLVTHLVRIADLEAVLDGALKSKPHCHISKRFKAAHTQHKAEVATLLHDTLTKLAALV
jgi:hypothetical protein